MAAITYVNGKYIFHANALVHIEDRGMQFADGVYEVIAIEKGFLLDKNDHFIRLRNSLKAIDLTLDVSDASLLLIIKELLRRNYFTSGALYLQITRGKAPRNHKYPKNIQPSIIMVLFNPDYPTQQQYESGVSAITCQEMRWNRCDIKSISLLANVMARQQGVTKGAIETLFIDAENMVTEGSASNIFIVDNNNVLRTHPKDNKILAGITRKNVLQLAKQLNIPTKEEAFSVDNMLKAKEVFITSTTKLILPVTKINGKPIASGKLGQLTHKLIDAYQNFIQQQTGHK